jgi:uncharacterized MAPEG superfamily protein
MPFVFEVLFIAAILPMLLAVIAGYLRYKQSGGRFDNHHPRQQQSQLTGLAARALAAQKNAWEALMFYTAMCVLAYVASLDLTTLANAAGLFLLSRLAHAVFYLLDMAPYRSLVFLVGWFSSLYIGIKAVTSL